MEKYNFDYYKDNFKEKFLSLLDIQYSNTPNHKRREKFYCDYEKKYYTNIRKTAKNWFRTDYSKRQVPALTVLINICNVLHCDIDYFLTPQNEYNNDVFLASNVTGLTKNAVENLYKTTNQNSERRSLAIINLNYLLGEIPEKGLNLLSFIYHYLFGNYVTTLDEKNSVVFMDKTGIPCNGVEIPISELNDLFMPLIQGQLQRIKADIEQHKEKWNNYGKYIPTEKDYEEFLKIATFQNQKAKKQLAKHKNNPKKQQFWNEIIEENNQHLKKLRDDIDKNNKKEVKQNEKS